MLKPNTKIKNHRLSNKNNYKEVKQKVKHVAQELKFARLLASNEKKTRDRALQALKKFLHYCQNSIELTNDSFNRIWSGLFYTVWMCDKPLVQEEVIDKIAELMEIFPENLFDYSLNYMKSAFNIIAKEWYGLDQYRMDKFMMLIRRLLRSMFRILKTTDFEVSKCRRFTDMLIDSDGVLAPISPRYAQNAVGLKIHIAECYIEELAKICEGEINDDSFTELLRSFAMYMCTGQEHRVVIACTKVFYELIRQTEMILEYQNEENYESEVDDEDAEDNESVLGAEEEMGRERPLDPRAGRVDVIIDPLKIPSVPISKMLRGMMSKCATHAASSQCWVVLERLKSLEKDPEIAVNPDVENLEESSDPADSRQDFGPRPDKYYPFMSKYYKKNKLGDNKTNGSPVTSRPLKSPPVQSRALKSPSVKSTQIKSPSVILTPLKSSFLVSTPQKSPSAISTPRKSPSVVPTPIKSPSVILTPLKSPFVVSSPQKSPSAITTPQKSPSVVSTPIKSPSVILTPLKSSLLKSPPVNSASKRKTSSASLVKEPLHGSSQKKPKYEAKSVTFSLSKNTSQEKSEFLKHLRLRRKIPFDANKQPMKPCIKLSTPSPVNPFNKLKFT